MSRELELKTNQETMEFMRKVEEKKKILAEAEAEYRLLCDEVDKTSSGLSALKMERFKVEGLIQELGIRVKVYEIREKELKEQDERAKGSINEAKNRLAEALEVRDSFDRNSSHEVIRLSTEYTQFKHSCFKSNVLASLQDLKMSLTTYTSEIESKMQNLGVNSDEPEVNDPFILLQRVYQPETNEDYNISGIRELQSLVLDDVNEARAKNANVAADVDMLLAQKSNIVKAVDALKKSLDK